MKLLILGANGFIGSHLCEAVLKKTNWHIDAIDLYQDKLSSCLTCPRFHFMKGDMVKEKEWVEAHIQQCDVVLPLVAIATPARYVQDPVRVFELDFEANLDIVRTCLRHHKHLVFPSTSEVYGMCSDALFDEETSPFVTGPVHKERWIYAASKQLLDRLIYAFGKHKGLSYTLFRPFNWYGPRLDNVRDPKPGGSRVLTQFIGNVLRGEDLYLVNGGAQRRCFTYIDDGTNALLAIIANKDDKARNAIFNIGNPTENVSVRQLAELVLKHVRGDFPHLAASLSNIKLVDVEAKDYYGEGYQDVSLRVPCIRRVGEQLGWAPTVDLVSGLRKTLASYVCVPAT